MVAVIHNSSSIRNALHYNENKVRQGVAKFIHSHNYPKDTDLLGFSDKLNRLERLIELNQRTKVNSIHISLNFNSSDNLNTEKLKDIADLYMQKIGFGEQPYLVYQHNDAAHPHAHIVTTNIRANGKRIELHNLARNHSEKARKEIEKEFGLIGAENKNTTSYELKPVNALKVQYGKSETKRAITNVLDHVLLTYKYASVAELNAVLQQYNIIADRGSENSRIYQSKGLVYRILDVNKQKVGVPIKASLIYNKPTLKNIEANFERNEAERQRHKRRVMNAVDLFFLKRSDQSVQELIKTLQKENIQVVLRQNDQAAIYGITYVDHHTKCVFNGSHLGKPYSANGVQQRCSVQARESAMQHKELLQQTSGNDFSGIEAFNPASSKLLEDLINPETSQYAGEPYEQKQFKKKRKRRQQQTHN